MKGIIYLKTNKLKHCLFYNKIFQSMGNLNRYLVDFKRNTQ